MKLILQNIGMLAHAEVTLHRLCVIAGENDNGKSTVGKILFCIVKAINRYKEDLKESKEFLVDEKAEEIYFLLREGLRRTESMLPMVHELSKFLRVSDRQRTYANERLVVVDQTIRSIFERVEVKPELKQRILDLRNEIHEIFNEPEDINRSIEKALTKVFASEFDSSLLLQGAGEGRIQLVESNLTLIHLVVNHDGVRLIGEVEPIVLKDATFIETPLILNNHDVLIRSQTLLDMNQRRSGGLGQPYTTLHTKDLFDKLRTPVLPVDLLEQDRAGLSEDIQSVIDGDIAYDRKERDFVFTRGGSSVSIKNTASGIKVFGLLKILVASEFVSKNTVLVFDEPENHLHPKWQLKLAEMLVKLVKNGVYVMVSSHSPYLIEALKRYVDREGLTQDARFCLAKEGTMVDEDKLGEIFEVLAEPFKVFRDMDAEDLRDE